MVDLKMIRDIYLYPDTVDFRKGIPALLNLILTFYKEYEVLDCIFVFFGRNKKQIKMIEINKDGTWLYEKRINEGNFIFPTFNENIKIDKKQLKIILDTISPTKKRNIS